MFGLGVLAKEGLRLKSGITREENVICKMFDDILRVRGSDRLYIQEE